MVKDDFIKSALLYHSHPTPGKLTIAATKPLANQRDLSLAYSPGVAAACEEIVRDPETASLYTVRSNLVAVITNGTAVLGLGNIGPLAAKPVMEGKGVLFKKFANIDVFDIEIDESDPKRLVDIIASLAPTFGAINLEDIRAPECFEIERALKERLNIPVFHDDQHGTAIIVGAAVLNGLHLVKKKIEDVKVAVSGAGAAAIACLQLLEGLGLRRENVMATDAKGVLYEGRDNMDASKALYAKKTDARTLGDIMKGADIFLGLSAGNLLDEDMLRSMAPNPLILALANPTPEVNPLFAREVRPDAIVATGRSDYPNQVNNVLCFPFIFRGALDVGATEINDAMKLACVKSLAALARAELSDVVTRAYGDDDIRFGRDYIIPKPFDPRLIIEVAPAVAQAAMDSGVAKRPIADMEAYRQNLSQYVYRSGLAMRPLFARAKKDPKRVVYTEGEDERILRATQVVVDECLAHPILIGRPRVVQMRLERLGLRIKPGEHFELIDPENDHRFHKYTQAFHEATQRQGVTPEYAKTLMRTDTSIIGTMMVRLGDADAVLCGPVGGYHQHFGNIKALLGPSTPGGVMASLSVMVLDQGVIFLTDGFVNANPTAEELCQITVLAADQVRLFGFEPKIALLSHSSFGSTNAESAVKMRRTVELLHARHPALEVEGEMHGDDAFDEKLRHRLFPNSKLTGQANLLVMPCIDTANIAFNLLKALAGGQPVGPFLIGIKQAAHILTPSVTVRGIINNTAMAVADAQRALALVEPRAVKQA
ncbi:MAG: NADP-dependent malic enzyme [Proteobacteria bacterium]|nr:NADP-dependent malic enzyme [Pseudomonadota bacterium]